MPSVTIVLSNADTLTSQNMLNYDLTTLYRVNINTISLLYFLWRVSVEGSSVLKINRFSL